MRFSENTKRINRIIFSLVALMLMLVLFFTATYSWLMSQQSASMTTGNDFITIDPDSGLEMNYGQEDNNQSSIDINKVVRSDFTFHECSSYNGKRIFFPLSEYSADGDKDLTSASTKDFIYREATVGDKNSKYISIDLSLYSKQAISVWLSNDTKIEGGAADAIRVAFIENEPNGKTTVFDNSEHGYESSYSAVGSLKLDGSVDGSPKITCNSLQDYTFDNEDGNVLFRLEAGVEKFITVNIWLEGTDDQCTDAIAGLEDLDIYIKFSTTSEDERTFYFIDNTLEKWVDNDNCYVFAINQAGKKNPMRKSDNYDKDHTWIVDLPVSTDSIQFARYNPDLQENKPQEWNIWEAGTVGSCSTYNAMGHSAGIWDETFDPETITVFDGTNNGWLHGSDQCEFHVTYTLKDSNGVQQNYDYKMSYQNTINRFSIIIPSEVKNLGFKRMDKTQTITHNTWNNLNRGSNFYYNITGSGEGYWSTRYIYIKDAAGLKGDAAFGAYFYNNSTNKNQWTGMHSKSPSGFYVAVVPSNIDQGVVFVRYNSNSMPAWNTNCYNQTPKELESFGSNNLFTTTKWTNNLMDGSWSKTSE